MGGSGEIGDSGGGEFLTSLPCGLHLRVMAVESHRLRSSGAVNWIHPVVKGALTDRNIIVPRKFYSEAVSGGLSGSKRSWTSRRCYRKDHLTVGCRNGLHCHYCWGLVHHERGCPGRGLKNYGVYQQFIGLRLPETKTFSVPLSTVLKAKNVWLEDCKVIFDAGEVSREVRRSMLDLFLHQN